MRKCLQVKDIKDPFSGLLTTYKTDQRHAQSPAVNACIHIHIQVAMFVQGKCFKYQ